MEDSYPFESNAAERPKISYWRKLGGGSLTISIIVHAIVLAIGVVWVLAVIPPEPEKVVDFQPVGSGGSPASNPRQQKQAVMMKNLSSRIAAKGASSSFTLPDPEASSNLTALSSLSGGMGGMGGSGGGTGTGTGPGNGPGIGGMAAPGATGSPFGIPSRDPAALVGSFYDLKQDAKRSPTGITNEQTREVIKEFVNRGWNENSLAKKYYQASQKLYQTKVFIPIMDANGAPAAFKCENEVKPSRWIIVYRGTVTPPKSGKYRFVGAGDDVLVVRLNNKIIFDHGYFGGTTGEPLHAMLKVLDGTDTDREKQKLLRDSPMKIPLSFYQYPTTSDWNKALGGLAVGPTFDAKAGTSYPIEILLSEIPGGLFAAALMIENVDEKYETITSGSPILPVFQVDSSVPAPPKGEAPPFAKKGEPWKIVANSQF